MTQFDPELSLHLVEYDRTDGQEAAPEWLRLCSERPWQWLDERAPDAEPNPTSVGRVFDESVRALDQCKRAVVLMREPGRSAGRRTRRLLTSKPCLLIVGGGSWLGLWVGLTPWQESFTPWQ